MTSKEVKAYYTSGTIDKLYKRFEKAFNLVDDWSEKMTNGDLMDENELNYAMQTLVGVYGKFISIAGAFDSLVIEYQYDYQMQEEKTFEKIRTQDQDHCKAFSRNKVSDLRSYASDFSSYCNSANAMIITCQSRLKRLVVDKGQKGVGFSGEVANAVEAEKQQKKRWNE
ncbi:MAG: hypothetical protein DRN27_08650 [Thermoplasmata archaeon]|nr:MAG: hypothetical protein DRN27_08650 [Thermoplasmata archaeon]